MPRAGYTNLILCLAVSSTFSDCLSANCQEIFVQAKFLSLSLKMTKRSFNYKTLRMVFTVNTHQRKGKVPKEGLILNLGVSISAILEGGSRSEKE